MVSTFPLPHELPPLSLLLLTNQLPSKQVQWLPPSSHLDLLYSVVSPLNTKILQRTPSHHHLSVRVILTHHLLSSSSIIFLIAYATLAPLVIFRLIKRETRCWVLIRPALFVQTRIGTWIIRAVMSKGNYASGWFIAEQVRE